MAGDLDEPFEVGERAWRPAIAQGKVRLRKQWLTETSAMQGRYTVRYVTGGVEVRRVA